MYRSPHESMQMQNSKAQVVRDVVARISAFCPPAHNWDNKRAALQQRLSAPSPMVARPPR